MFSSYSFSPHSSLPPNSTVRLCITFLASSYTFATLVLFFCVADQALGHAGALPLSPTLLCLTLLSPFTVLLLTRHCIDPSQPGPLRTIASNLSVLIPLASVALIAILLTFLPGTNWEEGGKWIFLIPYGVSIVLAATMLGRHGLTASLLSWAILASEILLAASIWYDVMHPGTFAPATNRAAGFPGNANFAALVSVMLCAVGLNLGAQPRHIDTLAPHTQEHRLSSTGMNLVLLVTTFTVVCMTMSRSGLINFSLLIALFLYYRLYRSALSLQRRLVEVLALVIAAAVAVSGAAVFTEASRATQSNSRLARFLNNQRVDDGSAGTRLQALKEGLNLIEARPILGHGTGFARSMSELPHNIYVQQWVNNGLLGVIGYTVFIASSLVTFLARGSRNGVALIAVAAVGGIFTHNILDQRPFLLLLGVLLGQSTEVQRSPDTVLLPLQRRIAPTPRVVPEAALEDQVLAR